MHLEGIADFLSRPARWNMSRSTIDLLTRYSRLDDPGHDVQLLYISLPGKSRHDRQVFDKHPGGQLVTLHFAPRRPPRRCEVTPAVPWRVEQKLLEGYISRTPVYQPSASHKSPRARR